MLSSRPHQAVPGIMTTHNHIEQLDLWIGGEHTPSSSGRYFDDLDPTDDSVFCRAAEATAEDMDRAVRTAHEAFQSYRQTTPRQREQWLARAADIIERDRDSIVDTIVTENGSPIIKARFETLAAADYIRSAAGITRRIVGETHPSDNPGRMVMSVREPLGVVGSITPFNVPFLKAAKLSAGALATGNTVVGLASEFTPRSVLLLGRVYEEAGFPPGTFNVITGFGADIGDSLTTHPLVRAILFTGSSAIGKHISALCGRHMKRCVLELGGKSPSLVLADADVDAAVDAAAMACFFFQGQGCMVTSRVLVERPIFDEFVGKLKARAEHAAEHQMGDLRDPNTWVGPIISERQRNRVRAHIEDARAKGATVVAGGEWVGNRCQPTILTGVRQGMTVFREETFGPVDAIYPVDGLEDGLALANDTNYGLSAAVWTKDIDKAMLYARGIESGTVHINAATFYDEPHVPFGGVKDSGIGREGTEMDIEALTEWKLITLQLPGDRAFGAPAVVD